MSERAKQVAEVVKSALELEPNEWPAFLKEACAGDRELKAEVDSLLQFQEEARGFIEKPALDLAAETLAASQSLAAEQLIGGYRVLSKIGEGGMGDVYLAQDLDLQRKVALKLVRPGMSTSEIVARFRQEEQILASLNHPNIAQLYGGGATEEGAPFFVMEYVEGERIDLFCGDGNLSTNARLQLFRKVCAAVHYAHQHLVIHRDLKPSNILVTQSREPKLLDFGIAKLLDPQDLPAALAPTLLGVMTPDYASPEQVRGEAITTASDVYSLGVILYELLTGCRPYRTKSRRPEEVARAVTEQEPARPSTTLSDGRSPRMENRKSLRGDLDNIILMALRKEPERRYSSVAQFDEDLRRHLENRPVIARKDTWRYRTGKFIRRNRVGVAAALLVILSLIAGIAATAWQTRRATEQARIAATERDRAERRFADVRQLSNALLFDIAPKIERLEGSTAARAALVRRALEYLGSLATESSNDAQLQGELAAAYEKVGELQGVPRKPNLGDFAGAIASYEKARDIRRRFLDRNPDDLEQLRRFAADLTALSAIRWWIGDTTGSLEDSQSALDAYQKLLRNHPGSVELALGAAEAQVELAKTHYFNDQLAKVYQPVKVAIASLEQLRESAPDNSELLRLLGRAYTTLSMTLSWDGKQAEGETEMAKAVAIGEGLVLTYPNDNVARQGLLDTYLQSAQLYEDADAARSFAILGKAREIAEAAVKNDGANRQARQNLAKTDSSLGVISMRMGKLDNAVTQLEKSSLAFAELAANDPDHRTYKYDQGRVLMYLGQTRHQQKHFSEALRSYADAAAVFEEIARADANNNISVRKLASIYTYIGDTHHALAETLSGEEQKQHLRTARESLRHALDLYLKLNARGALAEYDQKEMEAVRAAVARDGD